MAGHGADDWASKEGLKPVTVRRAFRSTFRPGHPGPALYEFEQIRDIRVEASWTFHYHELMFIGLGE